VLVSGGDDYMEAIRTQREDAPSSSAISVKAK